MAKKSDKINTNNNVSSLETNYNSMTLEDKCKDIIHRGEEIKEINLSEAFNIRVIYKINCGCSFIINKTLLNSSYYKLKHDIYDIYEPDISDMFIEYNYNNNQKLETLSEKVNYEDKYLIDLDTVLLNKDTKKNILKENEEENINILDKEAELYYKKMKAVKEFISQVKEYYTGHKSNIDFCLVIKRNKNENIGSLIVYLEFNYILYEYIFMSEKYSEQFLDDIEKFCENNIMLYYIII